MKRAVVPALTCASVLAFACDGGGSDLFRVSASLVVTPDAIAFDVVNPGTTAERRVLLTNLGNGSLFLESAGPTADSHAGFGTTFDTSAGPVEIVPNGTFDLHVSFTAMELGEARAVIEILSDDPVNRLVAVPAVAHSARALGPVLTTCVESAELSVGPICKDGVSGLADPSGLSLDLGSVRLRQHRDARITLKSEGTEALLIGSAGASSDSDPAISFLRSDASSDAWDVIHPGGTREVDVRFTPSAAGESRATYQITSNDPAHANVEIPILATGIDPALCLSPEVVDFGTVAVGETKGRTFMIKNCGAMRFDLLSIDLVGASSEFSLANPVLEPIPLAGSVAYEAEIRYTPESEGMDTARVGVRTSLGVAMIALTGRAGSCNLVVTPAQISFNTTRGTGQQKRVLVENTGSRDCTVSSARLAAGTSNEFILDFGPALPHVLASGASTVFEIYYVPVDLANDTGTFNIGSDDLARPVIQVPLLGHATSVGQCSLSVLPSPVAFGIVGLDAGETRSIRFENVGSTECIFDSVALAASSAPSFELGPSTPTILTRGMAGTVDVTFRPTRVATATGALEIEANGSSRIVALSGSGAGSKLCASPSSVIFGTHAIGLAQSRTVTLTSCGTTPVALTGLAFETGTSSEFSFPSMPPLPTSLAPGASLDVVVGYAGSNEGRDEGVLRVLSTDGVDPVQSIRLIGASSNLPCGDVVGHICGLGGRGAIALAPVWVDTPMGRVETITSTDGDFVLTCIPEGTWSVEVSSGSWSSAFSAPVSAYQTTQIAEQCLDPSSARVAVVYGVWDRVQTVLDQLNVSYTLYGDTYSSTSAPTIEDLLLDPEALAEFDIIFFNCGFQEGLIYSGPALQNIRDYVLQGGSIYASDFAYDLIEVGWPASVDFYLDDTVPNIASAVPSFRGMANITDPELQGVLGARQVAINNAWSAIDFVGPGTVSHLEADHLHNGVTRPMMVSFRPQVGAGPVVYTNFHNDGQARILELFGWLIAKL